MNYIELDFGEVEAGTTKTKSIKIVNQSNNEQSYIIQRDPLSNPLDCVFHTKENSWLLSPCESYICDVTYTPSLPNRRYIDYFIVSDACKCCYQIVAHGSSIGPKVTCPTTKLTMICKVNQGKAQKCIKLINNSSVPGKFMFDVDVAHCPFKINEPHGVVKPCSSKSLNLSFEPDDFGIYKFHVPCIILNQSPIIFELYGVRVGDSDKTQTIRSKIENIKGLDEAGNFKNYINNVSSSSRVASLSRRFIDFGYVQLDSENFEDRTIETVRLTNHTSSDIYVVWNKDVSEIFNIQPNEAKVFNNDTISFELYFDPLEDQTFYSTELTARVFKITNSDNIDHILTNIIPEFVCVRLIGHTYCHNTEDTDLKYEIPEKIVMPPCVPGLPAYNTFFLKNTGHGSLMFRFFAPVDSRYSVKPTMGLINSSQEYQLFAVELSPRVDEEKTYVEKWPIELYGNNTRKNEIFIEFQGIAERARVVFGDNNSVTFDPVHVGCSLAQSVSIRNVTRQCASFEYLHEDFPKELRTEVPNGVVYPNETIFHNWIFTPDRVKNYAFDVRCILYGEIDERKSAMEINVTGNSTEGSIIAIPDEVNFGDRTYNETCKTDIKLFNFSSVTINFLLSCRTTHQLEIMINSEKDVTFLPSHGMIEPGKCQIVQIILKPTQSGFYELTADYVVVSNVPSENPILLRKPEHLCIINCMCYLPTLQVKDLLYIAETNKLISKVSLWKSLNIDELNTILNELPACQEVSFEMTIPLGTMNDNEKFVIKLLLTNQNPIDAVWIFKKKRTCLCNNPNVKNKTAVKTNFKTSCLYCLYDESTSINPKKIKLTTNETAIVTIEIKSDALKSPGINWDLNIGEGRHVIMNFRIERSIILSDQCLKFQTLHIGHCSSMHYQAIWLYNDTNTEKPYKIDTKQLAVVNKKNYGVILTCLNPEGGIPGHDRKPVFFGFCPNRFGSYEVMISVTLGDKESVLFIDAESNCNNKEILGTRKSCPLIDSFTTDDILAYFNNNCLILPVLPTHGKITKIVMMSNRHETDVLQYNWRNYEIPGFVKVIVEPTSGLIQPESLLTFIIRIHVGYHECLLDVDIYCNFVNVSERRVAEKKRVEQAIAIKQMDQEFTITDKGIMYQTKPVFETIKKPTTFWKTLTITVNVRELDKIDLQQQLKNIPNEEYIQESNFHHKKYPANVLHVVSHILECTIWDIVNSKYFGKILKEYLTQDNRLKYSQLPLDEEKRDYHINRCNLTTPKLYVANILHNMISMIIHEEFNLHTDHFSHPPDVRQISYTKVYAHIHKRLIDKN